MKYLKKYEIFVSDDNLDYYYDDVQDHKFKINDYVKYNNLNKIFKIIYINLNDANQPYIIANGNEIYPTSGKNIQLATDYEVDSIKYNL